MRTIKYTIFILSALLLMIKCSNDPFYEVPIEFNSAYDVFTDSMRAEMFINNMYSEAPAYVSNSFNWMHGNAMFASATDEAMHVQKNKTTVSAATRMSNGNWGPANMRFYRGDDGAGNIASWMKWGGYHGIRKTNTAIKYLIDENLLPHNLTLRFRNRLKAEALFHRAYYHWTLFQKWGGIPIVDKSFQATDDVQIPRNTLEETVNFILSDITAALELLPDEQYQDPWEIGRVDKGACLALKSRLLLYAASKLYNGNGYDNSGNLLICFGSENPARWADAAKAAQDVIDLGWYQLYDVGSNATERYQKLFNAWGSGHQNREMIFGVIRSTNRDTENDNFPAGFTNSTGGTCPSQDLVDAYEMEDGRLFDWNNPEHASNPYIKRDPRFYASIIYNGAKYSKFANKSNYTFKTYEGGENAKGETATETSYYLNKFMDYVACKPDVKKGETYHIWMEFRYAEILLSFAEAANEAGGPDYKVPSAKTSITPIDALNLIRERAGMPDVRTTFSARGIPLNKDNLRDFIYNERRIELAFENHRYYDVRRWMIIEQLPQYIRGCKIIKNDDNSFTYDPNVIVENKIFQRKHYFFPIPQVELNRNKNLIQNPGW